jgi:hypothetical protein
MSYKIEKLPGERIILIYVDPYDFSRERAQDFERELTGLLDSQPDPVFVVNIMPPDYHISVNDLLDATKLIQAQSHIYHHAKIKGLAAVSTDDTLKMAYEGLSNTVFGNILVTAFSSLEDALDFARSH